MKKVFLILSFLSAFSFAKEQVTKRVGGQYVVADISTEENEPNVYKIKFNSETSTGKYDSILLETYNLHLHLEKGSSYRISAEILKSIDPEEKIVEASQVLIFIPKKEGAYPVWILSKNSEQTELSGAKYIEMHAPQSDYVIF